MIPATKTSRVFLLLSTLGITSNSALAQCEPTNAEDEHSCNQASLVVRLTDIEPIQGEIRIALYHSEEAYTNRGEATGLIVPVDGELLEVTFDNLEPGKILVLLFHDLDSNGQLDSNFLGIPSEPYASSTGKRGHFGPPAWKNGLVALETGENFIEISLR